MSHPGADNRGPLLNIGSWFTVVAMSLFSGVKIYTKWSVLGKLQYDDLFVIAASIAAVGHCVAISEEVKNGLSQHQAIVDSQTLNEFYIAAYVSQIFYVLATWVAKLAGLYFFISLTPPGRKRHVVETVMKFVAVWAFVATLVVAFQCQVPRTWYPRPGHCVNQLGFWAFNGSVDISTQVCVSLFPLYLLSGLQLKKSTRWLSMLSFTPNLATIPLTILRLIYLSHATNSTDRTWDSFNYALITVLHTNTSIIAACIPFWKPFIDSLARGLISTEVHFSLHSNNVSSAGIHRGVGILNRDPALGNIAIWNGVMHKIGEPPGTDEPTRREQYELNDNAGTRSSRSHDV